MFISVRRTFLCALWMCSFIVFFLLPILHAQAADSCYPAPPAGSEAYNHLIQVGFKPATSNGKPMLCGPDNPVPRDPNSTACPPGFHAAKANEVPGVAAGRCTDDKVAPGANLNGGCDTNPFPELEKYNKGAQLTPQGGDAGSKELRQGINPVLACRLVKFFDFALKEKSCKFTITSGYRSAQHQQRACQAICGKDSCSIRNGDKGDCAPPGASCHQYGLAIDTTAPCLSWAQSYLGIGSPASGAQEYKIFFPIGSDKVHIQCIENRQGSCRNVQQGCDGTGGNITPDMNFTPGANTAVQSPMSQIGQALRNYLNPQPQQPAPVVPSTPAAVCIQYTPVSVPSADPCTYYVPPSVASSTNATSTNININNSTSSAISDLINAIANPPSATTTATGTPITLNTDLRNGVSLTPRQNTVVENPTYTLGTSSSQTFTSQDLSQTRPPPNYGTYGANATWQKLEQLKQLLLKALAYLRPFGGPLRVPNSTTVFKVD
ncbi:D-alanyl-D-alanine carboxypeptidase family protein [Candidatus Kaiserbacteria bacterium]|nr:D-alanyl-D-alanine carboxypeptidase family protein [Candidatus Kaiserbacteria bacterium]